MGSYLHSDYYDTQNGRQGANVWRAREVEFGNPTL